MKYNVKSNIRKFTKDLEKSRRKDLPVVARQTLNSAAFGAKKKSIRKAYNKSFTVRNKGFIKTISKANPAKGYDLNAMQSSISITKGKSRAATLAAQELSIQEHGGNIGGRKLIPLDGTRVGGNSDRNVKKKYRISQMNLNKVLSASRSKKKSKQQRYIATAYEAQRIHGRRNGLVLTEPNRKGHRYINQINSVKRKRTRTRVNETPLFRVNESGKVGIKKRPFMQLTGEMEGRKMKAYFRKHMRNYIRKIKA